jgi:hypothetical protein
VTPLRLTNILICGDGAARGQRVTILEAQDRRGGRVYSMPIRGFGYPAAPPGDTGLDARSGALAVALNRAHRAKHPCRTVANIDRPDQGPGIAAQRRLAVPNGTEGFQSLPSSPAMRGGVTTDALKAARTGGRLGGRAAQTMKSVAPPRCSAWSALSWLAGDRTRCSGEIGTSLLRVDDRSRAAETDGEFG